MMVDYGVPAGAQPIVETGPGVYTFEWNPSDQQLVCDVGIGMTRLARLDFNNRTFTTSVATPPPPNAWTLVQLPDGSVTYSPNFNPDPTSSPDKTTDYFDYGYTINQSDNQVKVTFMHGVQLPTALRFKFYPGSDDKPNNMAIQVFIAPASNKDNYFAGYQEPRPPGNIATSPDPNDPMNQPMKTYPTWTATLVDMKMLRQMTPDDLNAIVRIWVDPQPGGYLSRADHFTFGWAVIPQWNNSVWGGEINPGVAWTLGRETGQPSYDELAILIR
jgi:hypothetical protein